MVRPSGEGHAQFVRALSFGSVAEQYERYRPGYPNELVDAVFQHATRPVYSALEVGAGTGKATRLFASRGVEVIALEPDVEMAGVLEKTTLGLPVTPIVTTFEEYEGGSRVDLVYAAAAWHWTDPATRMVRAAELLSPGGVLALFGTSVDPADPDLLAAVEEIEKEELPDNDPAVVHPWSLEELDITAGFVDSAQLDLPRIVTRTAEEFVGRLATVSAYLMLSPEARGDLLSRIRALLPDQIDVDATVQLSMARRA
ncbi:MAG: class I SAM-dependent methyltransferase [Marmoricola sp.]